MWKVCDDELISDIVRKVIMKAINIQNTKPTIIDINSISKGIILVIVMIVRLANASYDAIVF